MKRLVKNKAKFFILIFVFGMTACSNNAEIFKLRQECNEQFTKSKVELVTCLNQAEASGRDTEARRERQQFTLQLAQQVDEGKIT